MARGSLGEIAEEIRNLQDDQQDTTLEVASLVDVIQRQIKDNKRGNLDALEASRKTSKGGGKGGGSVFNIKDAAKNTMAVLMNPLTSIMAAIKTIAFPALIAIVASLTGFDAVIKALRLPYTIDLLKSSFTTISDIFGKIAKSLGSTIKTITGLADKLLIKLPADLFEKLKLKIPKIPGVKLFMGGVEATVDMFKMNLPKIPGVKLMMGGVEATADMLKSFGRIKLPDITKVLPKFVLDVPEKVTKAFDNVKALIGSADEGKGILGLFSKLGVVADTVLKPLAAFMRTAGKIFPITSVILSVIDFFVGFYEGFKSVDADASFGEKMMAALEGGLLGLIKGITEAFDLIFIGIPAWLAEKFGFEGLAEILRSFSLTSLVDPLWFGIKGIIMFVVDNFVLMKDIIVTQFKLGITQVINGVKNAFTSLGAFIANIPDQLYLLLAKNIRFSMPEVSVPIPFTGGKRMTVIPAFTAGVGDDATIAATAQRIEGRNKEAESTIAARDAETAKIFQDLLDLQKQLRDNAQASIAEYNNRVDNSTTIQNDNRTYGGTGGPETGDPNGVIELPGITVRPF